MSLKAFTSKTGSYSVSCRVSFCRSFYLQTVMKSNE